MSPFLFLNSSLSFPGTAYSQIDETNFQETRIDIGNTVQKPYGPVPTSLQTELLKKHTTFLGLKLNIYKIGKITSHVSVTGMLKQ